MRRVNGLKQGQSNEKEAPEGLCCEAFRRVEDMQTLAIPYKIKHLEAFVTIVVSKMP